MEHDFIKDSVSDSLFWIDENSTITSKDENGNPAEGTRLFISDDGKNVITRWKNGFLDGDSIGPGGKVVVQPAVEADGHLEYWRNGKLHRDGNLPAVSTSGFSKEEWWNENRRIR